MKLRELLRRRPRTCDHVNVRCRPVVVELSGTGASDEYMARGFGRYWCTDCDAELGTGNFEVGLQARIELEVETDDHEALMEALRPPLKQDWPA